MTVNKGVGMTDAEWNEIVRRKAQDELDDKRDKKDRVYRQREKLRGELSEQMSKRREQDMLKTSTDR